MFALVKTFPDPDVLLALEPEELAAKILFVLREQKIIQNGIFHPGNLANELENDPSRNGPPAYHAKEKEVGLALAEAFAWLEAQGLIVPASGTNGSNGFRRLSRRAVRFESADDFAQYAMTRRLDKELLHPGIAKSVWMAFMRGELDVAVFQAMKAVEVAVRNATDVQEIGVKLMRAAFNPNGGPLTDMDADFGEREALAALFVGAIGSFKNPHSHREVSLNNAGEAIEIILLANHLLRIVDRRRAENG